MKFIFLLVLFILLSIDSNGQVDSICVDDMNDDLNAIKVLFTDLHPALRLNYDEANLDFSLGEEEGCKSYYEFYTLISNIVSRVSCGHTSVLPRSPGFYIHGNFPINLKYIDNKVVFGEEYEIDSIRFERGSEIKAINGISIDEIQDQFLKIRRGVDHKSLKASKESLVGDFSINFRLLFGNRDSFDLDIIQYPDNKLYQDIMIHTYDFSSISTDTLRYGINKVTSIGYIRIPTFSMSFTQYREKLDQFFHHINENQVNKLIIDLRDNGGGSIELMRDGLSYLIPQKEKILTKVQTIASKKDYSEYGLMPDYNDYVFGFFNKDDIQTIKKNWMHVEPNEHVYQGELVILINGGTFSAATIFSAAAKSFHQNTTIIGTESGGSSIRTFARSLRRVKLPHSRFSLTIPTSVLEYDYNAKFQSDDKNLIPDIIVQQQLSDFYKGYDNQLRYAVDYLKDK